MKAGFTLLMLALPALVSAGLQATAISSRSASTVCTADGAPPIRTDEPVSLPRQHTLP
jgi:hypothetical protein